MFRASLVAAMLLGTSLMAVPASAAVENQPRLIQAEYVWKPWPYPGHWEWRGGGGGWEEHRGDRHCRWLRRRLEDLRDGPRWDRDWGEIREMRRRFRMECSDY